MHHKWREKSRTGGDISISDPNHPKHGAFQCHTSELPEFNGLLIGAFNMCQPCFNHVFNHVSTISANRDHPKDDLFEHGNLSNQPPVFIGNTIKYVGYIYIYWLCQHDYDYTYSSM